MKCLNCKKPTGKWGDRNKLYCDINCRDMYYAKKNKKYHKEKKCKICGKEFKPKSTINTYCSFKCGYQAELLKRSKKPLTKKCKYCKKEFKPYTSLDKFCSANCRVNEQKSKRKRNWGIGKSKGIEGVKNPAYRNGNYTRGAKQTAIGQRLFIKNANIIKQNLINERGCIYCEDCGLTTSIKYESHHIIFRSEKPLHKNLHDKENIIILCIDCHNEFHKHKSIRNYLVRGRKLNEIFGNDIKLYKTK